MGKNGYLQRQKQFTHAAQDATRQTYTQFLTDTLILTLNDSEVMGKDTFGEERIRKVLDAWGKKYDEFFEALMKTPETDYVRQKMDNALKAICKSGKFVPFEKRYDYLPEISYEKKR